MMPIPETKCEVCNYEFKKEDNVITHVIEDETGMAMVGFTVCESCNENHEYHYGVAEMAYKPWFTKQMNGIYCPKCRRLIVILPKQDRDFDEIKCPHGDCKGIWVNKELELVQSPQTKPPSSESG